ncbi:MAG: 3-dehydroquinate synthase [Clostridia bacterium]|nr:3-dehydroquinate synthase [Clostridia bacterium]
MIRIPVKASVSYDVIIGSGVINEAGRLVKELGGAEKIMLVSDDTVYRLYGKRVRKLLSGAGFTVETFVFKHGESSKNIRTYGRLLEKALSKDLSRSDIFAALGGGVTGDLTGFAAATYKRGVRFVQFPTTLLSAVDASVGGKTAIDLRGGKNQAGAFHQPSLVLCDTDMLDTLPDDEYKSGMAEAVKSAMLCDPELFKKLERAELRDDPETLIASCVNIKRRFVAEDEFDRGSRMLLNFGHTFGHAIEAASGYTVLHGFAVAAGMAVMARSACNRGYCSDEVPARLERTLEKFGLPSGTDHTTEELLPFVAGDKKAQGGSISLVVPAEIGKCVIEKADFSAIEEWMLDGGIR